MPNLSPSEKESEGRDRAQGHDTKERRSDKYSAIRRGLGVYMQAFIKRNKMCHFRLDKLNITN